jgi:iron complex transport system permease protein
VTFAPSATEVLFALGLGGEVVGVSGKFDDYPKAARSITEVGGAGEFGVDPNIEKVVSLNPDLVLTIEGGDQWKVQLRHLGIPVFTTNSTDLDDVMHDIQTVGEVTDTVPRAEALTSNMAEQAQAIDTAVSSEPDASCFFEVAFNPLYTVGPGSFIYDLLQRAGCDPVTSKAKTAYPTWSVEDLVRDDPSVYLVSSESGGSVADVEQRPGYDALSAVRNHRVYLVNSDLVSRAGPRGPTRCTRTRSGGDRVPRARAAWRFRTTMVVLAALLVVAVVLGVGLGAVGIAPGTVLSLFAWKLHLTGRPDVPRSVEIIVFQLRLPRVLLAAVVGMGLAVAGLLFQGLFRNPMADPAVIGVSSGAALGAIVVILAGGAAILGGLGVAGAAFAGALLVAFLVYRLARIGPAVHVVTLLLAGIAVAAVMSGVMSVVMSFSGEQIRNIYFWILGGLSSRGWSALQVVTPIVFVGTAAAAFLVNDLNLLALGEERAAQLGVEVERTKRRTLALGSLLAAAAVSVSGVIGFVGLMTPLLLRLVIGADHRRLLPACVLAGPTILILADLASRTLIAPEELPLGAVTAVLGGPFFLYLLRRQRRARGGVLV